MRISFLRHIKFIEFKERYLAVGALSLLSAWLFFYVALEIVENGTGDKSWIVTDQQIRSLVLGSRSDFVTGIMLIFTALGSTLSVSILAFISICFTHFTGLFSDRRILFFSSLAVLLFIRIAKWLIGRTRPASESWLTSASGLSFPSGHSAGSFAVLGALFFILGRRCPKTYQKITIWIFWGTHCLHDWIVARLSRCSLSH